MSSKKNKRRELELFHGGFNRIHLSDGAMSQTKPLACNNIGSSEAN